MDKEKEALDVLRKYENRPSGYNEDEIVNAMIEFAKMRVKNCSIPAVVGQLIDFQNFLIMDGQLDLDPDEVKRYAELFLGD